MLIDFNLPEELIATHPSEKRDHCKMLVFDRATQKIHHSEFHRITDFIDSNYFLVLNQAKVNPCRMTWMDEKNRKQEILFLKNIDDESKSSVWEAIVSGKKINVGDVKSVTKDLTFTLLEERKKSFAMIRVNKNKSELSKILYREGQMPLPPYILKKRRSTGEDDSTKNEDTYQTIYSTVYGAVAAPTAGLHFTDETFADLKSKKIDYGFLNLAVGWGTFAELTPENFSSKKLHAEYMDVPADVSGKILEAMNQNKKILGVGTTSIRALETWAQHGKKPEGFRGYTEIFITPGDGFQVAGAMLTNFHIPKSSLLLLVAAFLGKDGEKKILEIYNEAIAQKYHFYSYGDCMLIL